MQSPLESQTFLFMWIGFLLLMSCGVAAFFFWGIRSGQFSDQERARFLALRCGMPKDPPDEDREVGRKSP